MSSFFTCFNKKANHDELAVDQAIQCLEAARNLVGKPERKKRIDVDNGLPVRVSVDLKARIDSNAIRVYILGISSYYYCGGRKI
jgi:hypothetical protein